MIVSLLQLRLLTGRTHQIRVHCQFLKHPIIGDQTYGGNFCKKSSQIPPQIANFPHQALHAAEISFFHPHTGELLEFKAGVPNDMQALIDFCEAHDDATNMGH
jgi:23S rRNA pseudouridine1911/1915/1917 synthase